MTTLGRAARTAITVASLLILGACASGGAAPTAAPTTATDPPQPTTTTTEPPTTTTTEPPTTTTTEPPTTTTTIPAVVLPPPPESNETEVLASGSRGPRTQALQVRLLELHYDPGPLDGSFGTKTTQAVWAFQHLHDLPADGAVTPELWAAIEAATDPAPQRADGGPDHVEIDIPRQVLSVWDGGELALITHISSGTGRDYCDNGVCGTAITPRGDFTVLRRISGWRHAPLGELYNPLYFHGGFAMHGSGSVPNGPASHGCVRVPMHIAEYLPGLVPNGEPVFVF